MKKKVLNITLILSFLGLIILAFLMPILFSIGREKIEVSDKDYKAGGKITNFQLYNYDLLEIDPNLPTLYLSTTFFDFGYIHLNDKKIVKLKYRVTDLNINSIYYDWIYWDFFTESSNLNYFWVDDLKYNTYYKVELMLNDIEDSIVSLEFKTYNQIGPLSSGFRKRKLTEITTNSITYLYFLASSSDFPDPNDSRSCIKIFDEFVDPYFVSDDLEDNPSSWTEKTPTSVDTITFDNLNSKYDYTIAFSTSTVIDNGSAIITTTILSYITTL